MRKTEVQLVEFFPEKNDMNDIFFFKRNSNGKSSYARHWWSSSTYKHVLLVCIFPNFSKSIYRINKYPIKTGTEQADCQIRALGNPRSMKTIICGGFPNLGNLFVLPD